LFIDYFNAESIFQILYPGNQRVKWIENTFIKCNPSQEVLKENRSTKLLYILPKLTTKFFLNNQNAAKKII